jgi:hypothetical protein
MFCKYNTHVRGSRRHLAKYRANTIKQQYNHPRDKFPNSHWEEAMFLPLIVFAPLCKMASRTTKRLFSIVSECTQLETVNIMWARGDNRLFKRVLIRE